MFCIKCGYELKEDMAFCPKCGYKISGDFSPVVKSEEMQESPEKIEKSQEISEKSEASQNNNETVINSEVSSEIGTASEKKDSDFLSVLKNIFSYKNYCLMALVLVILTVLLARFLSSDNIASGNNVTSKSKEINIEALDLSSYLGKSEDDLVSDFGFVKNDNGMYPDIDEDAKTIFICDEGKVASINLTKDYRQYNIYGLSVGESIDEADKLFANWERSDGGTNEYGSQIFYTKGELSVRLICNNNEISEIAYTKADVDISNTINQYIDSDYQESDNNHYDADLCQGTYFAMHGLEMDIDLMNSSDGSVGTMTIYQDGIWQITSPIWYCYEETVWNNWNYSAIYATEDQYGVVYLCVYGDGETIFIDYNSADRNMEMYSLHSVY